MRLLSHLIFVCLAAGACLLADPPQTAAQSQTLTTAAIGGVVQDSTGGIIPDDTILLIRVGCG